MRRAWIGLASLLVLTPALARAQRLVAHDTLSDATPTAVTCGFCVGEAFGVIFRELEPPLVGLDPADFPLELREVQIALAAARTTGASVPGYACSGDAAGGSADVDLEVWSGGSPPTGSIRTMPGLAEPWAADETLLWAGTVSVELSVPEIDGESRFRLTLNRLPVVAEDGSPIVIPPPATYLRVVAWLSPGGSSTLCEAQSLEAPSGVPVRDDDGVIAPERGFLHAAGVGWLWSEEAEVAGDWGVRLLVLPSGAPRDGGTATPDAAAPSPDDGGGELDGGGSTLDAGSAAGGGGGCSCRAAGRPARAPIASGPIASASAPIALVLAPITLALALRRARRA